MSEVVVIGGGAAGILAAISAAYAGHRVSIYEKNEKLGKKLFITGKGRCNLTNSSDMATVMSKVVSNPKFLYSAFKLFTNEDIMRIVEEAGCPLKCERGNRVFPVSDHSSDILKAFIRKLDELGVGVKLHTEVSNILVDATNKLEAVILKDKTKVKADAVILCTGGLSYPATGSTGDGYKFARALGHKVTKTYPSLVPFEIKEDIIRNLQGLALKNVELRLKNKDRLLFCDFGELLFTHFGLSGPLVLSASSYAVKELEKNDLDVYIDLKPAMDREKLELRLLRDFEEAKNKSLKNSLVNLLPLSLIPVVLEQANLDADKKIHDVSKAERNALLNALKALKFTVTGTRGFKEAIITKGGIDIKDINPKTMESKLVKGLFFAGEVLDLDALTGGYNLQIAWSTAWCAGGSIDYV